ncbi:MAG: phosphate ABC transporter ATP-binding protein [bacterium]
MTANTHIEVKDLNVHYGAVHALKNIHVSIPNCQITAVIGPSGCGKSTLLRSFNRMLDTMDDVRVTGGVLVDGENIFATNADVPRLRRKMGLLSQRPFPLPMSIYDNVAYGPRIHGIGRRSDLDRTVEKYLRMANMWDEVRDRLHEPAARLSIGQQQRLCLARGLAVEPEIILADEPTSALDPISSRHIEHQFRELKADYTLVIVTHILRQARRLADYVLFMYLGELIEHGPAAELFENPREDLTKDYIKGTIS